MREKVNQAAKGIFTYSSPPLKLSVEELAIEVDAGSSEKETFTVRNGKKSQMRGAVYSDCHFLEITDQFFQGTESKVRFTVHGETLQPGNTIRGNITVITDCGTGKLPFTIVAKVPCCEVSSGKIRDLFHFTHLAKEHPDEAAALFRNPRFEEVFLYRDNANIALYRGLSKGSGKRMAMEEFLIAIHKKLPVLLAVNKTSFQYADCRRSFTDNFMITKNNWGFGEYHIQSDSAFVVPEHKIIWADDFMGNTYSMSFLVDAEKMLPGRNYARITISTIRQKIEITVIANKIKRRRITADARRERQKHFFRLVNLHLEFCMGRIDKKSYLREAEDIVSAMEQIRFSTVTQLVRIHLGMIGHHEQAVKNGLYYLKEQEEDLKKEDIILYCAYLYLRGLWSDDDADVASCVSEISAYYKREPENWKLLWFLLYLSPSYQSERKKYEDIVKQFAYSCHSPILFLEACSILNDMPELLTDLSGGICEAIHWGIKKKYLKKDTALRYCYLAGRLREYSDVVRRDLCSLYRQFPEEEILISICKTFMKGQRINQEASYWYSLGVENNLKLTDLFEYYMYTINEGQEIALNDSTLVYFLYDNHLTMAKKAMLYAYIVRNKRSIADTYKAYRPMMQEFAFRQLEAKRISRNLAVLYEEFVSEKYIDEKMADALPAVMFCHEVACENKELVGVYVMHRELVGEEFVPFHDGKAIVHIFTDNYQIFLADSLDNRYVLSIDYTADKLLHLDHLAMKCFEKNGNDSRLLLYLYDKSERFNLTVKDTMEIRRRVLEIPKLSKYHYKKAFCSLVRYYYEEFEGELLDLALRKLEWSYVNPAERTQFVEYCAVRRYFEKAMEGIMQFGYEKIDGKRLLKISSHTYEEKMEEEDVSLCKLAYRIFQTGNFDERMMRYLCRYFSGEIQEMAQVWKYAEGFAIETEGFAERILGQIIFTGEMVPEAYDIFYHYQESGEDRNLSLAFMNFIAYHYLVHGWEVPDKMFPYFYREVQIQENICCLAAVLKHFSQKDAISEDEAQFADYNINKLYKKRMVFPFFRDFYGKIPLPMHILDEYYVEYTADPACEVKIRYIISSGYEPGNYETETMRDIFGGIRVKEFVIFQDETLRYDIIEVRPEGETVTKSVSINFGEAMDNGRTSSRCHMLNLMMMAQEMKEESTLIDLMKEYVEQKESVRLLFQPIE